jgi:hypothetical protein
MVTYLPFRANLNRFLRLLQIVLDDDGEGKALSELVGTLAWSGGISAIHLRQEPRFGGVDFLKMLLGSSGHK